MRWYRRAAASFTALIVVLFVFSGVLKWIRWFPVDPTLLFGAAVAGLCFVRGSRVLTLRGWSALIVASTLLFFLWYAATAAYTLSADFWKFKIATLLLDVIAVIAPVLCFTSIVHFDWFDRWLRVLAAAATTFVLWFYVTGQMDWFLHQGYDKESLKIPDYLAIGSIIGLGLLSALAARSRWRLLFVGAGLAALLLLTARGPIMFAVLTIAVWGLLLYAPRHSGGPRPLQILVILGAFAVALMTWDGARDSFVRFSKMFSDQTALAGGLRVSEFADAVQVISKSPVLGVGLGGYGSAAYGSDENIYPHNLFLEALAEAGVVGFLLFLTSVSLVVLVGLLRRHDTRATAYFVLIVFLMLNYVKSGGFVGARDFYAAIGVFAAHANLTHIARRKAIAFTAGNAECPV